VAVRPFVDTLRTLRSGLCEDELATALQSVVQAVSETGKAGSLTLTIDVKPMNAAGALVITDTIKTKLPVEKSAGTVLWATPEGNLQLNHPKQNDLPGLSLAGQSSEKANAA
jgi:hypothetical protein